MLRILLTVAHAARNVFLVTNLPINSRKTTRAGDCSAGRFSRNIRECQLQPPVAMI
jgi:hypothetical protein